ncbi:hypothetical protein [Wenxinia marina]|uniref:Lipoprotein n=1 Tax=Wenxinia marina DSM 24838 TaxID=1123501 RepID=A0A0D0QHF6_9RHOB|nr:hypothetical protein [Wenxinia marina]KIQ70503.1 hypothetical protein Wenmar_00879 [Wenxinia marina DSM 24838]
MRVLFAALPAALLLTACAPRVWSPEEAAQECEQRARAAQGPTGAVTLGYNSNSGPYTGVAVGVSGDYLTGRDPLDVYRDCVVRRTGAEPYRPPRLR